MEAKERQAMQATQSSVLWRHHLIVHLIHQLQALIVRHGHLQPRPQPV